MSGECFVDAIPTGTGTNLEQGDETAFERLEIDRWIRVEDDQHLAEQYNSNYRVHRRDDDE